MSIINTDAENVGRSISISDPLAISRIQDTVYLQSSPRPISTISDSNSQSDMISSLDRVADSPLSNKSSSGSPSNFSGCVLRPFRSDSSPPPVCRFVLLPSPFLQQKQSFLARFL